MRVNLSSLACAAFIALASTAAKAEDDPRWYGALHGELSWAEETDLERNGTSIGDLEFDIEYAVGIALGYQPPKNSGFWANTRWEAEIMYREIDFDDLSNQAIAPGGFGGSVETYTGMLNAFYDFHNNSSWTPYLGVGLGYAQHDYDSITIQVDDDDTAFAYQGMAGVAHRVEPYENVHIGLGYRYFGTQDISVTSNTTGFNYEQSYDSHNLEAFIRIGF